MKINNISIVIPVLNEEKNLVKLIEEIKKIKNKIKIKNFELIIIDDNSNDNSKLILKKYSKKNRFIKFFIRKKLPRDLSKSCLIGFNASIYENILVMDGDLQHPPRFIKHLSKKFFYKKADIVIGSRNLLKKKNSGLGLFRYLSSVSIIYLINFFLGNKTSDPLSGFFIFKKEIYKKNKKRLYVKGYKILADLIFSSKVPLKIFDQNIFFDRRKSGKSKMNIMVLIQLIIFIIRSFLKK
mgnify:CR=1 FL=1